jgi:transglutaminase-like putative cysteine protease
MVRSLDDESGWLGWLALLAVVGGWQYGAPRRPAPRGWLILLLSGLVLTGGHAGEFWEPLGALARAGASSLRDAIQPAGGSDPWGASAPAWLDFSSAVRVFAGQVSGWISASGGRGYVAAVSLFLWASMFWVVSVWAGWVARRFAAAALALVPGGILLGSLLAYAATESFQYLLPYAAAFLSLHALHALYRQEQGWARRRLGYSEELRVEFASASLLAAGVVVTAASLVSYFNLPDVLERFTPAAGSGSSGAGEALGVRAPSEQPTIFDVNQNAGLPRLHLLGSGPELAERVALVVTVEDTAPPAARYYWRALTYDVYNGSGWETTETAGIRYRENQPAQSVPRNTRLIRQYVRGETGGLIHAAGDILTLDRPFTVAWRDAPEGARDPFGVSAANGAYAVNSLLPSLSEAALLAAGEAYPDWVAARYLALPPGIPERVFDLAVVITRAAATPYEKSLLIERFLRAYEYSLDLPAPPLDRDIVDYFLFDLEKGYCDYYATAMVVMLRGLGIPARLAMGYATGNFDAANGRYIVTEADAHSWVEVYFPQIGWVTFEPTGGLPGISRFPDFSSPQPQTAPAEPFEPAAVRAARGAGVILLAGAALFAAGWQIAGLVDGWRLARLPAAVSLPIIYRRLAARGAQLGVHLDAGATPYEFERAFAARLDALFGGTRWARRAGRAAGQTGWLVNSFVTAAFAPAPPDDHDRRRAIKLWRKLRSDFWLVGLWINLRRPRKTQI